MKKLFTLMLVLGGLSFYAAAQLQLQLFSPGYVAPIGIENCGDSRLFIVQQGGQIMISDASGNRLGTPYLDISDRISMGGERGLLGLAFDPGYAANGFFYVNYTNNAGNTQISRFSVKDGFPNEADDNSEEFILNIRQPFPNHNGGCIRFGPDGYLYIGMGDGGSAGDPNNNAQNPMSLLGKMLRIDVHSGDPYNIPPDNPFVDSANYRPEIWALGLRNPWRWSFDALTGAMVITDVGQDDWEEINVQLPGKGGLNYGWRCAEGNHPYNTNNCKPASTYTFPVYEYAHRDATGDCSVTGGFVYRGTLYPQHNGKYFFVDYCSGIFRALSRNGSAFNEYDVLNGADFSFTSFGEDQARELYVSSISNGSIYRLTDGSTEPVATGKQLRKEIFSVSPNPSNGAINLRFDSPTGGKLLIYVTDIMGQKVYEAVKTLYTGQNLLKLDLNVPAGNYFLKLTGSPGETFTQQLRIY